jgi:large conductance mechanosensitive channel
MSLMREFREFAVRGNVVDLAVAVIIGAAFNKIVTSLVEDIVMPAVGALGGVEFKELAVQVGAARILYGKFIQSCIDFLIIAASVFVAVKVVNAMRHKEKDKPPAAPPPREERLLEEIRDLLKQK